MKELLIAIIIVSVFWYLYEPPNIIVKKISTKQK